MVTSQMMSFYWLSEHYPRQANQEHSTYRIDDIFRDDSKVSSEMELNSVLNSCVVNTDPWDFDY